MPPSADAEGVAPEHHYHLTQRLITNSISLGQKGIDTVKPFTPTRVQSLIEQTGDRVNELVVEPYAERAQEMVSNFDARLDTHVISPTVSVVKEASQRADSIITTTESRFDTVRHQMGFVGASITDSYSKEGSDDGEETDDLVQPPTTLLQVAQDRVSTLRGFVQEKYYKVLENADHSIEVYFPEVDAPTEEEKKILDPLAICVKAAKCIKPMAVRRLHESKARTEEQLQKLVHVDLISYAAEVIDVTAATTYDVTVKKPLALKLEATVKAEQARDAVAAKVADIKGKVADVKGKVADVKAKVADNVQPVLERLYSAQVAEAYKLALDKATAKRDMVLILVASTKSYVSDKAVLVYNDGVKGLVLELRTECYLPQDGQATLAYATETLRNKANKLTEELVELAKNSPELAKQKLTDLYAALESAKDSALEQAPVLLEKARRATVDLGLDCGAWAAQQAEQMMTLLKKAPRVAAQQIRELYARFLNLGSIDYAGKIQTLCSEAEARFPRAAETVKHAITKFDTDVKPVVQSIKNQWVEDGVLGLFKNAVSTVMSKVRPGTELEAAEKEFDLDAARKAAQGTTLTEEEKKARGLLYDTSKASAVREESDEDEDEGDADFAGGDPFDGI
jgi:hypothetical protein